jgi:hypothetical protein
MIEAESDQMIEEGQPSLEHVTFTPSSGPPPNWKEKIDLAKRQDKLLRQTARAMCMALAEIEHGIHATRWTNALAYIEDAYNDLKDDYAPEGDEGGDPYRDYQAEFRDSQLAAQRLK